MPVHHESPKTVSTREVATLVWGEGFPAAQAPSCFACGAVYERIGGDDPEAELEEVRDDAEGSPAVPAQ